MLALCSTTGQLLRGMEAEWVEHFGQICGDPPNSRNSSNLAPKVLAPFFQIRGIPRILTFVYAFWHSGEWKKHVDVRGTGVVLSAHNWRSESHRRREVRDAPDSPFASVRSRSNNAAARHENRGIGAARRFSGARPSNKNAMSSCRAAHLHAG